MENILPEANVYLSLGKKLNKIILTVAEDI